jgi:hypothetical protein
MTRATRFGLVALAGLFVVSLAACGVRVEDRAVPIDEDSVPFGLTRPGPGARAAPGGLATAEVVFVGPEGLVNVPRAVTGGLPGRTLRALLVGPTEQELASGITTALPSPDALQLISVEDGVAHVRLQPGFRDGTVPDQSVAFAQIVLTLTGPTEIDAVSFSVDRDRVAVPRADGTLTDEPVGRRDYESMYAATG